MATKTVYQTDPLSRIFLYSVPVYELLLDPGVFSVPYAAYEDAPPDAPEGYVPQRNEAGTEWRLVEDHRQDSFYLTETGAPYALGEVVEVDGVFMRYLGLGDVPVWLAQVTPEAVPAESPLVGE